MSSVVVIDVETVRASLLSSFVSFIILVFGLFGIAVVDVELFPILYEAVRAITFGGIGGMLWSVFWFSTAFSLKPYRGKK